MDKWREGRKEGLEKGLEKGELKHARSSLIHLLSKKFTNVPEGIIKHIEQTNESMRTFARFKGVIDPTDLV